MNVQLTRAQRAFVSGAIASGRLQREEDAVREALALWEQCERARAQILAAVDVAETSLARGMSRDHAESMQQLVDEVKRRGRARLAAEQSRRFPS